MIDEKLIEIISNLKYKNLSDTEIIDVLLENNYTIKEINYNLDEYNKKHGLITKDYFKEYKEIQETVKKSDYFEKKNIIENKKNKSSKKKNKTIFYIILLLLFLAIIFISYIYIF